MKKKLYTSLFLFCLFCGLSAQTTATFESFALPAGGYLDGSDGSGGFSDGHVFLPNIYDANYAIWSGWAISATADTLTPGFTNQYSAITGAGYDGSATYAVTFASPPVQLRLTGAAEGGSVAGMYVTNSTYTYLSIRDGDGFAKKFGGETGDDPDFFRLTIKKYLNGELSTDSIDFYLADYRFADNSQDYIIDEWTYIDLLPLGNADSLWFALSSSDVGQYGMNTPAYFCMDNITTLDQPTALRDYLPDMAVEVFPNPVVDELRVNWGENSEGQASLFDAAGKRLDSTKLAPGSNRFDMSRLPSGAYYLRLETRTGWTSRKIIRHN